MVLCPVLQIYVFSEKAFEVTEGSNRVPATTFIITHSRSRSNHWDGFNFLRAAGWLADGAGPAAASVTKFYSPGLSILAHSSTSSFVDRNSLVVKPSVNFEYTEFRMAWASFIRPCARRNRPRTLAAFSSYNSEC